MRSALLLLLLCSCEFGPSFFDCDVDESAIRALAEDRGVLSEFNRLDVFCESRIDVGLDCQNGSAEACTVRRGSAVSRARIFASGEATEGLAPLLEHEFAAHLGEEPDTDACADHPPSCDGLPGPD